MKKICSILKRGTNINIGNLNLTEEIVEEARDEDNWSFSNEQLYRLCKKNPDHKKTDVIMSKLLIIGRTYAAAIERGRVNNGQDNADFYQNAAARIKKSKIDTWLKELKDKRCYKQINKKNYLQIIETHYKVTKLFSEINGNRCLRSLSSKYLHFHLPKLFYIYDTRAAQGLSKIAPYHRSLKKLPQNCDDEYAKFVVKVLDLQEDIKKCFNENLIPRQIDRLLLQSEN